MHTFKTQNFLTGRELGSRNSTMEKDQYKKNLHGSIICNFILTILVIVLAVLISYEKKNFELEQLKLTKHVMSHNNDLMTNLNEIQSRCQYSI